MSLATDLIFDAHLMKAARVSTQQNRLTDCLCQIGRIALLAGLFCLAVSGRLSLAAQDDSPANSSDDQTATPSFEVTEPTTWEFGLRIEATGTIQGITATCPIPVDWPEQVIEVVEQLKSSNVTKTSFDDLPQNVRLLVLKVNSLQAGETAEATVRVRVHKKNVIAPTSPESLRFVQNPAGKLKPFVQSSPYIETGDRAVKDFANSIVTDPSASAWHQVESIYDTIRERIPYEFDPKIRTCPEAIERGKGDCEELSSLFIAVCRIKQIPARAIWIPEHTYPEFYLEDEKGVGNWYPCQLAGSRQFGGMVEPRPILQRGDKFKTPGNSQPTRYVQPTLVAKDAESGPKLVWISRELKKD